MRIRRTILIAASLCMLHASASHAGNRNDDGPRVRVKLGVSFVGGYPFMATYDAGTSVDFSPKYALGGAFDFDVRFGKRFSLATDVVFKYTKIGITDQKHRFESSIGAFAIQLPIKAVLHLGRFALYTGPVITLMDDPSYYVNGEKTMFGRIYPTMTYTAGACFRIGGHLNVGISYDGAFNTMTNYYAYNMNPSDAREIRTQMSNVCLNVGFMF